jgi:multidrug transporter EmrE-like cation transporter
MIFLYKMILTPTPLVAGLLLTMVEAVGDFSIKKYVQGSGSGFLGVGIGVYLSLVGLLVWLFKTLGLAITNSYWDATSNIVSIFVGACLLGESYTLKQWLGMAIVGFGMFLIGN